MLKFEKKSVAKRLMQGHEQLRSMFNVSMYLLCTSHPGSELILTELCAVTVTSHNITTQDRPNLHCVVTAVVHCLVVLLLVWRINGANPRGFRCFSMNLNSFKRSCEVIIRLVEGAWGRQLWGVFILRVESPCIIFCNTYTFQRDTHCSCTD